MQTDADRQALLAALNGYRALVAALKCADRVAWVDAQISLLGSADELSQPVPWGIYEHTLVRNENAKVIQALETYIESRRDGTTEKIQTLCAG